MTVTRRMCGRSWVEARGGPQPKLYIPSHFLRHSLLAFNSILASYTAALPTVGTDYSGWDLRSQLYGLGIRHVVYFHPLDMLIKLS
jgi:hypothetical protein